jgi:signal transduction histidine kinase
VIVAAAGRAAVIVLTGLADERLAEEAVRRGAQDYLVKGSRQRGDMMRAIHFAVRRQQLLVQLKDARDAQLAAKDQFLSHVSHELRSPLAVVYQFVTLLSDEVGGSLTSEQRDFVDVITRNVTQLRAMIDDLLSVSHAQRNTVQIHTEIVDVAALVEETIGDYHVLAVESAVDLDLAPEFATVSVPQVLADPDRVREVLRNLLDNSLKFTPAGGRITVSASVELDFVKIMVTDTGRGIHPADLPRIFDQFFQSTQTDECSRNGLGLGLFVSRDLVRRQGGEMYATSELGHGTSIAFTLPTVKRLAGTEVHR